MWETICDAQAGFWLNSKFLSKFSGKTLSGISDQEAPPISENFRFGMTKVYSGIPPRPHFGKLQIWADQSLLRNTPPNENCERIQVREFQNTESYYMWWLYPTRITTRCPCPCPVQCVWATTCCKCSQCKFLLPTNVSQEAWIGTWANSTTNTIEFTDGSTFDYTPSPLNAGNVSQSCIAIHRNYSAGRDCNERKRFICASTPLHRNGS